MQDTTQDFLQLIRQAYQSYTIHVNIYLDRVVETLERYGKIKIHLAELIEEAGISKNKLSQRAEMQRTQLNHYCNNTVTRLDVDVLARLCAVLNCKIEDLLEFVPPEQ